MNSLPKGLAIFTKAIVIILVAGFIYLSVVAMVVFISYSVPPEHTTITDVSEYGIFIGNRRNDVAEEQITAFFPKEITDDFSDITYAYRAIKESSYTFEAYLEFTIEDSKIFYDHIAAIAPDHEWQQFEYDSKFREYNYANSLDLIEMYQDPKICVEWADISKVLYSEEDRKVIYVAIGANHDGFVEVSELSTFFNRFQIDPEDYEKSATSFFD